MSRILPLVLVLFLVTACGSIGGRQTDTSIRQEYRTGTQGLLMRFLPGTPPPRVYEGDPLVAAVEVTNKGTFDVSDGRLYLSGFDPTFLRFNTNAHTLSQLPGKSLFNPDGLFSNTFDFEDQAVSLPNNANKFTQTLKVTACYPYRTQATAMICVDSDPYSARLTQKVCTVHPVAMGGGQGAPVAVTYVAQESTRDRMQFKITVQNVGDGDVISPSAGFLNCHEGLDRRDIDKVQVTSVEFSGNELRSSCEPNPIRLINGQGFTFCSFDGRISEEAFTTALNMVFDYSYRQSISTTVDIHEVE